MLDRQIHVLLVEDSPTDELLVRANLGAAAGVKFKITSVAYLSLAIQQVKDGHFDVILLDLGLPDAQGLETFERMHRGALEVPIIVLSGLGDEEIAVQSVQRGAQDFLPKSQMNGDLLARSIRYAIERYHAQVERERYAMELQLKNQELLEELTMAREIQQALLPHQYPHFFADQHSLHFAHYYRPAAALSGDFFSVLRLSENQAGVLICDVMGHGVRAALIGTLARGLVDQFMPVASQPGEFLSSLNHELSETFKQAGITAFATAFYYVADLATHELSYANAGHPNALILRRDDGVVDWLRVNGHHKPPLGMLDKISYPSFHSTLGPHDSILLFTDGLYEAENSSGEQFGRERLMEAVSQRMQLPCERMLDALVSESQKFAGSEDFSDDVCLVGMDVIDGPSLPDVCNL